MKVGIAATVLCSLATLSSLISASPVPAPEAEAGAESAHVERQGSWVPTTQTYDDRDGTKYGSWTTLTNYGHNTYQGSLTYTGQANAEIHFESPFLPTTVQNIKVRVYSTKKNDRAKFNVYCGHILMGTGNEYTSGGETNSQLVFSSPGVNCNGGEDIVIKNDKGARFLAIDKVEIDYLSFAG